MSYAFPKGKKMTINRVLIEDGCEMSRFRELEQGQMFRYANRCDDCNVYMKVGIRSFMLKNGTECSPDPDSCVVPLKKDTVVRIIASKDCD